MHMDSETFEIFRKLLAATVRFLLSCFSPATPRSPYPVVQECPHETIARKNCSLDVPAANITCSVFEYFPDISLSVFHKSVILGDLRSVKWNNTDGTMNKAVTVAALASDDPYVCVASFSIPGAVGSKDQYSTSVFLTAMPVLSTTEQTPNGTLAVASRKNDSHMLSECIHI